MNWRVRFIVEVKWPVSVEAETRQEALDKAQKELESKPSVLRVLTDTGIARKVDK